MYRLDTGCLTKKWPLSMVAKAGHILRIETEMMVKSKAVKQCLCNYVIQGVSQKVAFKQGQYLPLKWIQGVSQQWPLFTAVA